MDLPPPPAVPPLPPPVGYGGYGGFISPADFQARQDEEHLRLLSIFHYVVGGLTTLFGCLGLLYVAMGIIFVSLPASAWSSHGTHHAGDAPPPFMGWLITGFGTIITLFAWTVAALTIYSGICLKQRRKRTLSLVTAGLNCLQVPFGTALGVFTFMVLNRPTVQALYARVPAPNGPATSS